MGNSAIKEQYLEKIFNLSMSKYVDIDNQKVEFLDGKFHARLTYDNHFSNIYKVLETITKEEKDIKIIQIRNEESVVEDIKKIMKKYMDVNIPNVIEVESFYFDSYSKQGKTKRLIICQKPKTFVTLNDFITVLLLDIYNTNYTINMEFSNQILINLFIILLNVIYNLHSKNIRKFNMNIFNILISKSLLNQSVKDSQQISQLFSFLEIHLSDIEINDIFQANLKEEFNEIKERYFLTIKNEDYHNLVIVIFQLGFVIKNYKKINFRDENSQKIFFKELFSFTSFSYFQLISLKNDYFEDNFLSNSVYKILKLLQQDKSLTESDLKIFNLYHIILSKYNDSNENEIMSNIKFQQSDDVNLLLDMVISILNNQIENNKNYTNLMFKLLYHLKTLNKSIVVEYFRHDVKNFGLLIQKYIIFVQNYYCLQSKLDMIDIIDECIDENISSEDINKFKLFGIFPLILSYINIYKNNVNFFNLSNLITKFSRNNSLTIVNLLEKVNFCFLYVSYLEKEFINKNELVFKKMKNNLIMFLNVLSCDLLKVLKKFLNFDEVISIFMNVPLIMHRKIKFVQMLDVLISLIEDNINEINEKQVLSLMNLILYFLIYKNTLKSAFLYSTCLSKTVMKDLFPSNFSEFGLKCNTCSTELQDVNLCIICAHRCHSNHKLFPLGYVNFDCNCELAACESKKGLELPKHLKNTMISEDSNKIFEKSELINYPNDNEFNNLINSPRSNVFISIECETYTIQSKTPICNISLKENDIIIDQVEEETISYFEVEIIMGGYYDQIAIGVTSIPIYQSNEFAGYLQDSVGYHGDDGKCFANSQGYNYGVKFGSGDIIGCGITRNGNVFYTHNQCILPLLDIKFRGNIFSIISLRGKYCSVKINHFPNFKFKFSKLKNFKNPLFNYNFSVAFAEIIAGNEILLKYLQQIAKNYKNNNEVSSKFKKYASIIHKVLKNNKKNVMKYLILLDEVNKKNSSENNKFYENEENFSKNQNIIERVLMRPIFEVNETVNNLNVIKEDENENKNSQKPKVLESESKLSIPHQSGNSLIKKPNKSCYSSCGTNCLFI